MASKKLSGSVYVFIMISLILFSGLRYHTGWDWEAYDYYFNYLELYGVNFFDYELGFYYLSLVVVFLGVYPYLAFSFITVSICFYVARIFLGWWACLFPVAYLYYGYFQNFSILRQGVASALLYIAFICVVKRNIVAAFLIFVISFLFHKSVLFVLVLFPILFLRQKWSFFLLGVFASFFFVMFDLSGYSKLFLNVFSAGKIDMYLNNEFLAYKVGFSLKYLEIIFCLLVGGVKLVRDRGEIMYGGYYYYSLMGVFCELIIYSVFNDYSIFYERFSVYFELFHAVFLVMLGGIILQTKRRAVLLLFFLALLVFFRYERLVGSPARIDGELSHYERFFGYCNIFYPGKERCLR